MGNPKSRTQVTKSDNLECAGCRVGCSTLGEHQETQLFVREVVMEREKKRSEIYKIKGNNSTFTLPLRPEDWQPSLILPSPPQVLLRFPPSKYIPNSPCLLPFYVVNHHLDYNSLPTVFPPRPSGPFFTQWLEVSSSHSNSNSPGVFPI